MKNKPFQPKQRPIQDVIMKAAVASARIEGVIISEKDARKSLQKVMTEIKKAQ